MSHFLLQFALSHLNPFQASNQSPKSLKLLPKPIKVKIERVCRVRATGSGYFSHFRLRCKRPSWRLGCRWVGTYQWCWWARRHTCAAGSPWRAADRLVRTRWDRTRWGSSHLTASSLTESRLQRWSSDLGGGEKCHHTGAQKERERKRSTKTLCMCSTGRCGRKGSQGMKGVFKRAIYIVQPIL